MPSITACDWQTALHLYWGKSVHHRRYPINTGDNGKTRHCVVRLYISAIESPSLPFLFLFSDSFGLLAVTWRSPHFSLSANNTIEANKDLAFADEREIFMTLLLSLTALGFQIDPSGAILFPSNGPLAEILHCDGTAIHLDISQYSRSESG
jgi:hypothetical protein